MPKTNVMSIYRLFNFYYDHKSITNTLLNRIKHSSYRFYCFLLNICAQMAGISQKHNRQFFTDSRKKWTRFKNKNRLKYVAYYQMVYFTHCRDTTLIDYNVMTSSDRWVYELYVLWRLRHVIFEFLLSMMMNIRFLN